MHYLEKLLGVKVTSPNTILVTSKDVKDQILKYRLEQQIIDNLKLMSAAEFEAMFCFSSDPELLHYLINNNPWGPSRLKVDVAKQLEKVVYTIGYLQLCDHPLFSYTQSLITDKRLQLGGKLPNYNFIFHLPRVSDLMAAVTTVEYRFEPKGQYTVNQFNYYLEEIEAVIEQIAALVATGTSFEQIHLFAPSNYHHLIGQVAALYTLPVNNQNDLPLLSHHDGRRVFELLKNNQPLDLETIEPLLVEPIVSIINKYAKYDLQKYWDQIEADFQQETITINKTSGLIIKSRIDSKFTSENLNNDYFFMLGNYQDGLVSYSLDTNIIGDEYRTKLWTTNQSKQCEDSLLYNILNHGQNVWVSTAGKLLDAHVSLANNLSGSEVVHHQPVSISQFSKPGNQLRFARANYIKETFNVETGVFHDLAPYCQVTYKDNKYTPITKTYDHLKLSYTSINDFYKCSYRFYLNHILRIKNGKFDNRKVLIGNIVHYVLENIDNIADLSRANIRVIIDNYITDQAISVAPTDYIYFDKLSTYLEAVCVYMQREEQDSGFDSIERERKFEMEINPNVSLVGNIDKLYSKVEGDNLLIEIYDYKTGNINMDLSEIDYGLNMQNLIYYLLIKDYYQHEAGEEILRGTYQQQIKPKILFDDEDILDTMKITGHSQLKHDHIFKRKEDIHSQDEFSALTAQVLDKVVAATDDILANKYPINPKIIKGKNKSCSYCPYQSICNKTINDYQFKK